MKTFIVTGQFIQMIDTDNGASRQVDSDLHPRQYNRVLKLILSQQLEEAFDTIGNLSSEVVDVNKIRNEVQASMLSSKTAGRFTMETDNAAGTRKLYYVNSKNEKVQISGAFLTRVLEVFDNGADVEPLNKFLDKAEANKYSNVAASDLFEFLAVNNHPLTTDGDFLAFKIVRDDLFDYHSGTVHHEVGSIIALDPSQVDFNRDQTCSRGLHFCSRDYLPQYGGFFGSKQDCALLILKINPSNVAAFPRDYKNAKGRAVQYQVLARMPNDRYHHIVEYLLSQNVVDVAKDVTDVKTTSTKVYRQLSEDTFEAMVEEEVQRTVDVVVASAGPTPTVINGRWTVSAVNVNTGRETCVANAKSRQHARELRDTYNKDFATATVEYRVVDQHGV